MITVKQLLLVFALIGALGSAGGAIWGVAWALDTRIDTRVTFQLAPLKEDVRAIRSLLEAFLLKQIEGP